MPVSRRGSDMDGAKWWDRAWSCVDGCTPCSPGCDHCWLASMAHRFAYEYRTALLPHGYDTERLGRLFTNAEGQFDGRVRTRPDRLDIPLRRKKPTVYAVWSDWCHPSVPLDFIGEMAAVIDQCPQHTFLLCTKRADRAAQAWNWMAESDDAPPLDSWPFDNAYFGLTICNQQEWDANEDTFLSVPGLKFLSHEPALGAINYGPRLTEIACIISGGESGPGARPSHPGTFRADRDQCAAAGVPYFHKQNGEWITPAQYSFGVGMPDLAGCKRHVFDDGQEICRVGLKAAGRLLDGREYNSLPWRDEPANGG